MKVSIQYFDSSFVFIIIFLKSQIKSKQSYDVIADSCILNCHQASFVQKQ